MDSAQSDSGSATGWSGIWVTAAFSAGQGLLFFLFFWYQRRHANDRQDLFEPRQYTRQHRSPTPFEPDWLGQAWSVDEPELLRCVGLDTYMFLRFVKLGATVSAFGCVLSGGLIPVYVTGKGTGVAAEQFGMLTAAKVEPGSPRLWAAVFCWWIYVAFILYCVYREWKAYTVHRHNYLAKGDEDTPKEYRFAVRVEQIPEEMRSNEKLRAYFERMFPNQIQAVNLHYQTLELQSLMDKRQEHIEAVEKAVAKCIAKPGKPEPEDRIDAVLCCIGGEKVKAIPYHEEQIECLNREIDQLRFNMPQANATIEEGSTSRSGSTGEVDSTKDVDLDDVLETPVLGKSSRDGAKNQEQDENDDKHIADGKPSSTAFVTFTSQRAKQAAVQCNLTGNPDKIVIRNADGPEALLWQNMGVTIPRQKVLSKQSAAFWIVGIVFWAFPVLFVISIANVNGILAAIGLPQADSNAFWYGIVAGLLPPLFLGWLMAFLYFAIKWVATNWVQLKSQTEVDSYVFYWHQLFQFANLWLILIGGSLFNQISSIKEDPTSIVQTVAKALPGAAIFFVNKLIVDSLGFFGMELSMLPTYRSTMIKKLIQPPAMQTQREIDEARKAPALEWGQTLPPIVFSFLVMIAYMPIVPLIQAFAFIYFAGSYIVYKHQCLHVYAQEVEGGGETTWQQLYMFLLVCLYMGEVVFIAYMGMKKAGPQSILGFVPLGFTILFQQYVGRTIIAPLQHLPLEVAATVDIDDGELDPSEVSDTIYRNPALDFSGEERGPMPYRRDEESYDQAKEPLIDNVDDVEIDLTEVTSNRA